MLLLGSALVFSHNLQARVPAQVAWRLPRQRRALYPSQVEPEISTSSFQHAGPGHNAQVGRRCRLAISCCELSLTPLLRQLAD